MANNQNLLDNFLNEMEEIEEMTSAFEEESTETTAVPEKEEQINEVVEQEDTEELNIDDENTQQTLFNDDFEVALKKSAAQSKERVIGILAAKNPVFKYASVNEEITDKEITFEQLREKYENDFPELEEATSISWTVTYGKTTENISKPSKEKVFEVKEKIEKSDKFITDLKKAKTDADKNPECIVKPYVKAQKKGEALMPSYKGFFMKYDEAVNSQKTIAFVPARDGRIYQIRKNPIGIFQSPAKVIGEFDEIKTGFIRKLPKVPMFLLFQVISFFRAISKSYKLEALVHLVYNTETEKYSVIVPKQRVSKYSVDAEISEYPENVIHVMDIHSHNVMKAEFSETDNKDEKATRLYGVLGRLDKEIPDIALRASNGGNFIDIGISDIFDLEATYPEDWADEIDHIMAEAVCEAEMGVIGKDAV